MALVIIKEPGQEAQAFRDVVGLYQLPEWTVAAQVCCLQGQGELIWYCNAPEDQRDQRRKPKRV